MRKFYIPWGDRVKIKGTHNSSRVIMDKTWHHLNMTWVQYDRGLHLGQLVSYVDNTCAPLRTTWRHLWDNFGRILKNVAKGTMDPKVGFGNHCGFMKSLGVKRFFDNFAVLSLLRPNYFFDPSH